MEQIFACEKCGTRYRMEITLLPQDKAVLAWQLIKGGRKMEKINVEIWESGCIEDKLLWMRNKLDEIVESINEQTEEIKHLWINLIDLQKEVLKIPRRRGK